MDSDEARRIVADIVLADVASDRSDTDDQRGIGDRLHDATLDNRAAEDYRALLVEALDLAAYLGVWTRDFGASVNLVLGALPIGAASTSRAGNAARAASAMGITMYGRPSSSTTSYPCPPTPQRTCKGPGFEVPLMGVSISAARTRWPPS